MNPSALNSTSGISWRFPTTRWTQVRHIAAVDHPGSTRGWEWLATNYWYPLYACARRRGLDPEAAADRTQDFFAWLIESDLPAVAAPHRGRFRSLLLTAFQNHIGMEARRRQRLKRGGVQIPLSLDRLLAEDRYRLEPVDLETPDRLFERRWALDLIERALDRLAQEAYARGRPELFLHLKDALLGSIDGESYAAFAHRLGITEGAVKTAVHRLRLRFRTLVRKELADALPLGGDVEEEVRQLQVVLSRC